MEFHNLDNFFFKNENYTFTGTLLGKGSFGSVYVVENKEDKNQKYAAKLIDITDGFDLNQQKMFLQESLIAYNLDHPAIVKFKGINLQSFDDKEKLQPTIITEYLSKGSLRANIDDEARSLAKEDWTPTKKSIILIGIADAMRYLHKNNILHLDIKLENILIDEDYRPRLCDFGLSRCLPGKFDKYVKSTVGGKIGTPYYMAPEIIRGGHEYNSKNDVYSFGLLAYEVVTGEKPFGEISYYELTEKIKNKDRPKFPKQ